jgi:hypothetical protein
LSTQPIRPINLGWSAKNSSNGAELAAEKVLLG